jgi:BsuBI/PstI restriction endonuclease domain/BsuBI/PstI restriction endonuclease HTH domain
MLTTHELMQWMREHYDMNYASGSRENIRKGSCHQLVDAGTALFNPDDPARPVNSQDNCYQLAPDALDLLRHMGASDFDARLSTYLAKWPGLMSTYSKQRGMQMVPVTLEDGTTINLTAGGQNSLIKGMIEEFCPRWTPGGKVLYVGDAGKQDPIFDEQALLDLGVAPLDKHGKLPDLVVYMPDRRWLVLMEAIKSYGPMDGKRHADLNRLFANPTAGLVFVSCFPSRAALRKYLPEIAWETEVWCADAPEHLIHFNGERFLGPYE